MSSLHTAASPVSTTISPDALRATARRRSQLKGRQPDDAARAQVRALIGPGPHRRDRLIELLHVLNDAHRGLHEQHLVALAAELRLPMAEVYEVASFYHHFQILCEGETAPAITVRVCDG
ncbi:MAG: NADH-quinone oxidoreductase subunit F, partial [Comamonadaceae bacterium]|nr:NADH-quinone oxidoreductase subunit F [Comamonadaceae bacterium]